ncbi:MAG: hypothetical protein JWN85_4354 [Gammaproteobacteria bacterium]|nr:hypothetical protein [Gammaproteobacteria bacterium]
MSRLDGDEGRSRRSHLRAHRCCRPIPRSARSTGRGPLVRRRRRDRRALLRTVASVSDVVGEADVVVCGLLRIGCNGRIIADCCGFFRRRGRARSAGRWRGRPRGRRGRRCRFGRGRLRCGRPRRGRLRRGRPRWGRLRRGRLRRGRFRCGWPRRGRLRCRGRRWSCRRDDGRTHGQKRNRYRYPSRTPRLLHDFLCCITVPGPTRGDIGPCGQVRRRASR